MRFSKGESLIYKLCQEGNIPNLYKIDPAWFLTEKEENAFTDVVEYLRSTGELLPKLELSRRYKLGRDEDHPAKFEWYLNEVRSRAAKKYLTDVLPNLLRDSAKDPFKVIEELRDISLSTRFTKTDKAPTKYHESALSRYDAYVERKSGGGISYRTTGIRLMDARTGGYVLGDLWTFAGRSGIGKTWMAIILVLSAERHLPDDGRDILIVSAEMPKAELELRIDAARFSLDYDKLITGELDLKEQARYRLELKKLESERSRIIIVDDCKTLHDVEGAVRIFNPALTFVDSSYRLEPDMEFDHKKIRRIASGLKNIAKDTKQAIVQTTQLTRFSGKKSKKGRSRADSQDEFAFGMSYLDESDFAFRMYTDPEMEYLKQVGLEFAKFRRIGGPPIILQREENSKWSFYEEDEDDPTGGDYKPATADY